MPTCGLLFSVSAVESRSGLSLSGETGLRFVVTILVVGLYWMWLISMFCSCESVSLFVIVTVIPSIDDVSESVKETRFISLNLTSLLSSFLLLNLLSPSFVRVRRLLLVGGGAGAVPLLPVSRREIADLDRLCCRRLRM